MKFLYSKVIKKKNPTMYGKDVTEIFLSDLKVEQTLFWLFFSPYVHEHQLFLLTFFPVEGAVHSGKYASPSSLLST